MRFSTVTVFGLISSVFALPSAGPDSADIAERQLLSDTATVEYTIAKIKLYTQDLDQAILKITSTDLNRLLSLDTRAQSLNKVILSQITNLKKSATIGVFNALPIAAKAQDLINTVNKTLSDLTGIKQYVSDAGVSGIVVGDLQLLQGSADNYVDGLKAKVPSIFGIVADIDRKQIDNAFTKAIAAYSS